MSEKPDSKRRDFLQLSTLSIGAVGTAAFIWPFLKSISPAEDTLALGTTEVDVSSIEEGLILLRKGHINAAVPTAPIDNVLNCKKSLLLLLGFSDII